MSEVDKKLDDIEARLKDSKLKHLFKCFYRDLDGDPASLNIALNLFFGNFDKSTCVKNLNNESWKIFFKSSIKERYEVTKIDKYDKIVTKYKLKDPSKIVLEKLSKDNFLREAKKKWGEIKLNLNNYFTELKFPIQKTIIYEAPPYLVSIVDDKNNNEFNTKFTAEFIFDTTCSSPYEKAIRNCFENEASLIQDVLINNKVGFFDVIPIPIPINSALRKLWATEERFIIDGKRIFIHFFDWALEIYLSKLGEKINKDDHKLAIGIPLKNAVTLYEYAAKNNEWPGNDLDKKFCAPHVFDHNNPKKEGLWVQQYKNCIIGSSNTPSSDLMKLAFEILPVNNNV